MSKELLLDQDSLFMQAFEYAPIGMAIVTLEGELWKVNKSALSIGGYVEEEILKADLASFCFPEDKVVNEQCIHDLIIGKEKTFQREMRIIHKNKSAVWIALTASVVRDGQGNPAFFIFQFEDKTEQIETKDKLRDMGKHFQLITDNSIDIISRHHLNGAYSYISSSVKQLLGYKPEALIGLSPYDLCHPDDIEVMKIGYQLAISTDYLKKLTVRMKCKNGEYRWFETTGKVIKDEYGNGTEILAFTRDITSRKQVELFLKESEESFRSLFDYHPDMIYSMDLYGNYTSVNPSFESILGYNQSEIIHKNISFRHITAQESIAEAEYHFSQVVKGKVQRYESLSFNKNGKKLYFDVTNIPIIVDNTIVGLYGIARNITEKKQAEMKFQYTKNQLESFYENNVDSIVIYNCSGNLIKVNEAFERTFGWKEAEVIGIKYYDIPIIPEGRKEIVKRNTKLVKKGEKIKRIETTRLKKDGTVLHVDISGFPIHNDEGNLISWAVIIRDITDSKIAEEAIRNSEKLSVAGQLAAGIAHEIRNPMTAIKGFIQLMRGGNKAKPDYLDIITSEIDRIELIISELLILAKPQEVVYKQANIVSILSEIKVLLETQAILNNVEIIDQFEGSNIYVYCEMNQIKQVCINFIKNSIEAMPQGGKLFLHMKKVERNKVRIQFIDQGCGIPKNILHKLGEPFYTTKEKGTGLGFMVSKKIIEDHGGTLQVESKENVGTKIEVYLPLSGASENEN
ncbi:PAS domain S-box protein [Evansella sp. AB-P1]|uniref:PAS domain S-box protein n=1 Tax=Evansella sp. AB-P1 TaxID=3037653 RepID=UPI00241EB429|nr:PAS domain S-box protein [Evansella sp. AB-P1]MDG5786184.1 PAS domain S-box protein [Evansella sp. AB-P1]